MTRSVAELVAGRDVPLGRYTSVRRFLPDRDRRMVGAWCLVDRFGPDSLIALPGMRVPPHPHTGLQTVTWLVAGEIEHRDSLGSVQTIMPGQLNLMTSGHGIAHSEESPRQRPPTLHGVQLWVALPDPVRLGEPGFAHHHTLPVLDEPGRTVTVVVGELAGERSPAVVHTPLVCAEITLDAGRTIRLDLEPDFEYAAVMLAGSAEVAGGTLGPDPLLYLGTGRAELTLHAPEPARLLLIGGAPFAEELIMWWNFVGRSHDDIAAARADWAAGRRFGPVPGFDGDRLPAPPMPGGRLRARDRNGRSRDDR
ncbi:MAG: quercetin 2,3-dioxygenase [Micromonosporaceae bacterium]|nr:quercetin 2,3-dioxygenase [Micromonosporaceae bacterium]